MPEKDTELIKALKLARSKKMFFVFVPKGPAGKLILSKKKIPIKEIAEARNEIGGGKPVIGKCTGPISDMVFMVAKPAPLTMKAALKNVARRDTGLTLIADIRVDSDAEEDEEDADAAVPGAPAPKAAVSDAAVSHASAPEAAAPPGAAGGLEEFTSRLKAVMPDIKQAKGDRAAQVKGWAKQAATLAAKRDFAHAFPLLDKIEAFFVGGASGTPAAAAPATAGTPGTSAPPPAAAPVLYSISIDPDDLDLVVGEPQPFKAYGTYSDGKTTDVTNEIVWNSLPEGFVSILYTGVANPQSPGDVTITATDPNNPQVTASINTTVVQAGVLESIKIEPDSPTLIGGESRKFVAMGTYSDGRIKDAAKDVVWGSSPDDMVWIDDQGVVTPEHVSGEVTITAFARQNLDVSGSTKATVKAEDPNALTPEQEEGVKREAFADVEEPLLNQPADEARDRRIIAHIDKTMAALHQKPPDKAALKKLVKAGGGKILDGVVKNMPDPPDREAVTAALEARFNITLTNIDTGDDSGEEGSKSIKMLYLTLMKVPERHIRGNKSLIEIDRRPEEGGAFYDPPSKHAVLPAGRADDEGLEVGNTTETDMKYSDGTLVTDKDGHVVRKPAELIDVEEDCKPKGTETPKLLAWSALHEVGHGVDDDLKVMDSEGGNDFAHWAEYPSVQKVADAAAAALHYDAVFIKELLTNPKPDTVLKPHEATDEQQKAAVAWCKAVRFESQLWEKGADCAKYALDKRVYHESYAGKWVSYDLDARKKGISGYQFRAPGEWFAELYAAYYSGKLKDSHPYITFIKKF